MRKYTRKQAAQIVEEIRRDCDAKGGGDIVAGTAFLAGRLMAYTEWMLTEGDGYDFIIDQEMDGYLESSRLRASIKESMAKGKVTNE